MNTTLEMIARDLSDLQESVSQRLLTDQLLMEKINRIRKYAFDEGARMVPRFAEDEILDGYFTDAVEQARRFVELAREALENESIPPLTMLQLVYAADLFSTKVYRWFHLRNLRTVQDLNRRVN